MESRVCNPLGIINCDCKFYDQSTGEVLSCITQWKCYAELLKNRVCNHVGIAYSDCQFHHKSTQRKCYAVLLDYRVSNPVGRAYRGCQSYQQYTKKAQRCTIGVKGLQSSRDNQL